MDNPIKEIEHALLRMDQLKRLDFLETKAAIEKGLKRGVSEMDVPAIMKEVEKKLRADGRLRGF